MEQNFVTLLGIVGVKFGVNLFSVLKMYEHYGEGMSMITIIGVAEGASILSHLFV